MLKKVYKRNGLNCVDMNGSYTYLPDNLNLVEGEWVKGEFYIRTIIVNTSI